MSLVCNAQGGLAQARLARIRPTATGRGRQQQAAGIHHDRAKETLGSSMTKRRFARPCHPAPAPAGTIYRIYS